MASDLPNITLTGEDGAEVPKRTVKFQCGLLRETETFVGEDVDILCRETLLDYICDMLALKFPEHPYGDLLDKLLLFKHTGENILSPLTDEDTIEDGTIIDIVLKAKAKQEYDDTICPHLLTVQTYRTPGTFCDYCGAMLFGLLKQGLKCEGCERNYHKKCAYRVPNNCTRLKITDGISNPPILDPNQKEVWSGRPLWIDKTLKSRQHVPHTFFVASYKNLTQCHYCKKVLKGVFRQGLKCKDCKINVHKRCAKEVGNNCPGEVPSLSRVDSGEWTMATIARHVIANEYSLAEDSVKTVTSDSHEGTPHSDDPRTRLEESGREDSPSSTTSSQEPCDSSVTHPECYVGAPMDAIAEEPSGEDSTSNEGSEHNLAEHADSADNIKLQRVTGVSVRHTKPVPASVVKEGWMVHYTNKSTLRKKHYWRLDTKCLTLYKSDTSSQYYKEIALADILAVDPMVNPEVYPLNPPHVFEIVTSSMNFYVGVDMTGALPRDLLQKTEGGETNSTNLLGDISNMSLTQLEDLGVGLNAGIAWEEALHSALMPITPQASMGSLADIGVGGGMARPPSFRVKRGSLRGSLKGSFHGNRGNSFRGGSIRGHRGSMRGSFRVPKQGPGGGVPTRSHTSNAVIKQPKVETKMDISLFYQIYPEEILGSGQFGTVYGGQNRQSGKSVAVKVIDKLRFPHKQESQLRTEVTILQTLNHPGIIFLEQMFETPEKIYVVMEKMNGDMLEMILNSPNSRLTERVTKFMIYQILIALQYLHKRDIVHCDLKPENVLLTSEMGMPLAKLCDFGFARIIGEKSFRKSIVGTPAYLAPEVLKNEGYNRSLDLWSVGVIVYVSLSGTFPFNEDEEISDQITNAGFMYPPDPWSTISQEAIDIINRLLQVARKSRSKANQALNHIWLRDMQLWEDLCQLEGQLGMRYLTHESEDNFWMKHGARPHPLAKQEAEQKAAELAAAAIADSQRVVKFSDTQSPISNGSPRSGLVAETPDSTVQASLNDTGADSVSTNSTDSRDRASSSGSKKDYLRMTDEEVAASEAHATRVGYKVTTI